jgi:hypothetical protein
VGHSVVGSAAPVVADSWFSRFNLVRMIEGSRSGLVQAATICMCVALYIIWWRRT